MNITVDIGTKPVRALLVGPLAGNEYRRERGRPVPWPVTCPNPDLVIAVDGGFDSCHSRRWRTDLVVGDFDSLVLDELLEIQKQNIEVVRFSTDKDFSDLDGALDEAVKRGATDITVIGVFGGRLDHQLAVLGSLAKPRGVPIVALGPTVDAGQSADADVVIVLHGGEETAVAAGLTFSVMALDREGTVSVSGAQWPLDNRTLQPLSSLGLSNRSLECGATVRCSAGTVAVIVPTT